MSRDVSADEALDVIWEGFGALLPSNPMDNEGCRLHRFVL